MFIEKNLYIDILKNIPIPTVDILLINSKNEILLGKRNNEPLKGVYYTPGGRVNKGEKSHDAVRRKTKEELGINIDISRLQLVGVYDDIFENSAFDGVDTHCISILYIYILDNGESNSIIIGDNQHSDFRFFSMLDDSLHDMIRMRIPDVQKALKIFTTGSSNNLLFS